MWFDDLASVTFAQVLRFIEIRFGASRWEGREDYRTFHMGEVRKLTAWARKRRVDPWLLMAAARYCAERELVVLVWWELEAYFPVANDWVRKVISDRNEESFEAEYAQALEESYGAGDGWYERLVGVSDRYRREVYEEWHQGRRLLSR